MIKVFVLVIYYNYTGIAVIDNIGSQAECYRVEAQVKNYNIPTKCIEVLKVKQ